MPVRAMGPGECDPWGSASPDAYILRQRLEELLATCRCPGPGCGRPVSKSILRYQLPFCRVKGRGTKCLKGVRLSSPETYEFLAAAATEFAAKVATVRRWCDEIESRHQELARWLQEPEQPEQEFVETAEEEMTRKRANAERTLDELRATVENCFSVTALDEDLRLRCLADREP